MKNTTNANLIDCNVIINPLYDYKHRIRQLLSFINNYVIS